MAVRQAETTQRRLVFLKHITPSGQLHWGQYGRAAAKGHAKGKYLSHMANINSNDIIHDGIIIFTLSGKSPLCG